MGINPDTQKYVPFHITDKQFATNLMNIMLRPLEEMGVRFWWLGALFLLNSTKILASDLQKNLRT